MTYSFLQQANHIGRTNFNFLKLALERDIDSKLISDTYRIRPNYHTVRFGFTKSLNKNPKYQPNKDRR